MAKVSRKAYWQIADVKALLAVSTQAVYDCLVVVYNNQTADEKTTDSTRHENGYGFAGTDAEFGSSLAKQVLAGRELSTHGRDGRPGQLFYARRIATKYAGQFAEALNEERAEKGLPTERERVGATAPARAAVAASAGSRFTWEPGDLRASGKRVYADELFEDDNNDGEGR